VFSGLEGREGDGHVQVVRCAHDHRVHVLAVEDGSVIAGREDLVAPDFLGPRQAAVVDIADRHELDSGHLEGDTGVTHTLAARAYQRQADAVAGGDLLAPVVRFLLAERVGRGGGGGRGARHQAEKVAAGVGIGHREPLHAPALRAGNDDTVKRPS
jgi:hypothetical protein